MSKWLMHVLVLLTLCLNFDSLGVLKQKSDCSVPAACSDVFEIHAANAVIKPEQDSRELQLQDMLVLQLLPKMHDKLTEAYSDVLTGTPDIYPYYVDVIETERLNGFRGFDLRITLQAVPTVGPHIPVGEDRFTFQISPIVGVKLLEFKHLKGPKKEDFPPNYQDILR
ncbi:DUF3888 domain-containing protein [Paenibacillus glycanilyticus]|uniref:DUF3888 domain-containing protein n=1 Tax=Paenibacillus glycanilyticus TaxID=126569 RepID=A0ABQ6GJD7_9BACL|nr:DUF3888 domain-containing protein [Paenibacillus glycanilyticus]GLX71049.1 hypothetical protein MU1_53970 [Paenibacillus glycanilyticus]